MSKKEFIQQQIKNFMVADCMISIAIGLIGTFLTPNKQIHFSYLFCPTIYALFGTLPSIVLYSKDEISVKKMMIRKFIHFILLEIIILTLLYFISHQHMIRLYIYVGFAVLIIDSVVTLVKYESSKREAELMMEKIKLCKSIHREDDFFM